MKRYMIFSLLLAGMVLSGFFLNQAKNATDELVFHDLHTSKVTLEEIDGVQVSIDRATTCPTGCTIVIQSASGQTIGISSDIYYVVQRTGNGKWAEVPLVTEERCSWKTPLFLGFRPETDDHSCVEYTMDINWEAVYGSLPSGSYLLVKEIFDWDYQTLGYTGTSFQIAAE
ncbi:MAG: hypothetical protein HFF84_07065 [Oscillibacter sp.]|nr:hypothetical protein [Oscillibacter sp.]